MGWRACKVQLGRWGIVDARLKSTIDPERKVEIFTRIEVPGLSDFPPPGGEAIGLGITVDGVAAKIRTIEPSRFFQTVTLAGDGADKAYPEKELPPAIIEQPAASETADTTETEGENHDSHPVQG